MQRKTWTMSTKELTRLEVIQRVKEKQLSQKKAAEMLEVSERHVRRLLKAFLEAGPPGLISKRRGKPGNHRLDPELIQRVIDLLHSRYYDFGPTLAREKLVEVHGLQISTESVRQLKIAEGLWVPRGEKKAWIHQMRERRACIGELVQIDGSPHKWFEDRGPACTLLVFIDDATGELGELYFTKSECFFSYAHAAKRYFKHHGKPVTFYSDQDSIFKVNNKTVLKTQGITQFGRAMQELDIEIICANTPQAKGRVERMNKTLQDRLVKELRLQSISTIQQTNAFMPEFIADYNRRFAVQPRSSHNAHRPLNPNEIASLDLILSKQKQRVISKNLTIQFNKVVYQIQTTRPAYALRKATVTVCEQSSGEIKILYKGHPLDYTVFRTQPRQSETLSTKEVDQAVNNAMKKKPFRPARDHPWRKFGYRINGRHISP